MNTMSLAILAAQRHFNAKNQPVQKVDTNVDHNGVNLSVLANGGETSFKGLKVFVHTPKNRGLPTARWHFRDACGNRVFIKTLKREKAQAFVNEYYGNAKYTVSAASVD